MIKISTHLSVVYSDPDALLRSQANIYWSDLNQKVGRVYPANTLISLVRYFRDLAKNFDPLYLENYAKKDRKTAKLHVDFFNHLLKNNFTILKKIIVSMPDDLELIKIDIHNKFPDDIFFLISDGKKQTKFGKLLSEKIFNYKKFRSSKFCLDFLEKIFFKEVHCPYCGYVPVELVNVTPGTTKVTRKALLDLDHFFSKVEYPYLAISLFNLIPCCHNCNSSYKGSKEFTLATHIHPYMESFDDYFRFFVDYTSSSKKISVKETRSVSKQASCSDFGIADRYATREKLLQIQRDYDAHPKYKAKDAMSEFVEFILKDVPTDRNRILLECLGKARRDLLLDFDEDLGLLRSHLK